MEFCTSPAQRSKRQKDVVPDSCYRRLKGILFFNRHTPVSNNKLKILLDERKDLSTALEDASTERRLPQEFRTWLEKCHRELDKEVRPMKGFLENMLLRPMAGGGGVGKNKSFSIFGKVGTFAENHEKSQLFSR